MLPRRLPAVCSQILLSRISGLAGIEELVSGSPVSSTRCYHALACTKSEGRVQLSSKPGPAKYKFVYSNFKNLSSKRSQSFDVAWIQSKIREYSERVPVPISIAQFLERGRNDKFTESESYVHIVDETLVRLAHLIRELDCLPQELRSEEELKYINSDYLTTFCEALQYENASPEAEKLREWTSSLKKWKIRHKDTVPQMAKACMSMKNKYGISLDTEDCALSRSVQYGLDRLYMSRISLNMLTDQHLKVYGHSSSVSDQIGVIDPSTDVESVVKHAYQNAQFLCEQCYLSAPGISISVQNSTSASHRVTTTQVPSHVYHMVFEVMKNAMQATIDRHLDTEDILPELKVLICQSDRDITIRISDFGGGIPRSRSDKIFKYLYTTAPRASLTSETVPLSGLGYGLPLARLYARYFQGEIRAASYEGYGTDIYIYLQALAGEAFERLPVWSPASSTKMTARSSPMPDWTSKAGYIKSNFE